MKRHRIKDTLRTLFRIRVRRKLGSADTVPEVGARLVLDGMRMQVDAPMNADTWEWLALHGWRECRYRNDRRRYVELPRGAFAQLRVAAPKQRERTHRQIISFVKKAARFSPRTT